MHESEKWKWSRSVVSDSSRPRGLQPTRLLCPWDFPDKSPRVGCPCLLWEVPASSSWVLPSPFRAPCLLLWPHSVSYIPFPTSQALLHGRDPAGAGLHTQHSVPHTQEAVTELLGRLGWRHRTIPVSLFILCNIPTAEKQLVKWDTKWCMWKPSETYFLSHL